MQDFRETLQEKEQDKEHGRISAERPEGMSEMKRENLSEGHYELNVIAWLVVVIVLAAVVWFGFLAKSDDESALVPDEDEAVQIPIESKEDLINSKRAPTVAEFVSVLDTNYPIPEEANILAVSHEELESGEIVITFFLYFVKAEKEEILSSWLSYAETAGWDLVEQSADGLDFSIGDGVSAKIVIEPDPSDASLKSVTVQFDGLLPDEILEEEN